MSGESGGYRLRLSKLNDQLTCKLCGGYFIDATTIIECLHSFCRSCIVRYLENNKYCPICEVQVHKSKPLLNIRPDHTLQDIVYKLVPGCYQNEMRCRREFYSKHPDACTQATTPEAKGEPTESHIYSPDESLSLSLEYFNPSEDIKGTTVKPLLRRYLRCPAAVTIFHLQKLIRAKYGLTDAHRVDVMYKEEPLCSSYTLMDVMYIYHWRRKVPLHLSYRIFESSSKRIKLSEDNVNYKTSLLNAGIDSIESIEDKQSKREWKEVQLKISETGIMSITDISDQQFKKNTNVDEPLTTVETMNASIIGDNSNGNDISEVIEQNKTLFDGKTFEETNLSKKLNKLDNNQASDQTENQANLVKTNIAEVVKSSRDKELKNHSDNNNDEGKNDLWKLIHSQELEQSTNTYETQIKNDIVENSLTTVEKEPSKTTKNNVVPMPESKSDSSKQQNSKNDVKLANTGSKINALSVKLQFQPKSGQVNNSNGSSKKSVKDKKLSPQSSKKLEKDVKSVEGSKDLRMSEDSRGQVVTNNCESAAGKSSSDGHLADTLSQKHTSESQNSKECALSTHTNRPSETEESDIKARNVQSVTNEDSSVSQVKSSADVCANKGDKVSTESKRPNGNTVCQKSPYIQLEMLKNENLASVNVSTSSSGSGGNVNPVSSSMLNQSMSTFSYTVQDLVNNTMLKSSLKTMCTPITQNLAATTISSNVAVTSSGIESSTTFCVPATSVANSRSSYVNSDVVSSKEQPVKTSSDGTSSYSVPPCPDAIPIALMKPLVRKNELATKGSNLNDICAKIGASGSKINDICAKIGESSKEKSKAEARSKSDIPDLLKIRRRNGSPSITVDCGSKQQQQHVHMTGIPIYESNSNVLNTPESKNVYTSCVKDAIRSLVTTSASTHASQKMASVSKKQSQAISYKTLRDPPRSWNPTLSKNNYIAVKNQSKETQNHLHPSTLFERSKTIQSKPAKIFKMRNMPRYLGNPASGVKPMYGIGNECKEKEQSTMTSTTPTNTSTGNSKNGSLSMMKIDPKTLSPIVSTVNSGIVSPPLYSPGVRNYPTPAFSRDVCSRSTGGPMSPKNSPVNILSTSPFIPSPTPNINPRLIYPHFPSPFPDATRFPNPLIRPPIGIPSPSAFHSSLPPSISKIYQRSSYIPQTTGFSSVSQPPTVQRIPPSTYSSPKSPKTTSLAAITSASYSLVKQESVETVPTTSHDTVNAIHAEKSNQEDVSAFNLSKTGTFSNVVDCMKTAKSISSVPVSSNAGTSLKSSPSSATSKTKQQDNFSLSNVDVERGKEQSVESGAKYREHSGQYSSKEQQNLEANRSNDVSGEDVNKTEKFSVQVNGDLTSRKGNKEEKTEVNNVVVEASSEKVDVKPSQTSLDKLKEENYVGEKKQKDGGDIEEQRGKLDVQSVKKADT